jgi:cbb3-type cytochrome oxidase cytochrome c subunit
LSEDAAQIQGYDQDAYARVFRYGERPIGPSLAAMEGARTSTAQLLHLMQPEDWSREGTHSESGRYAIEDWLRIYAAHPHEHAAQIVRARAAASS